MVKKIAYLVLLVLFFSCKKEIIDHQAPIISILHPLQNQNFNVYDTIPIQGIVTDNNGIASIFISLRNSNNINVLNSISITPNTTSYQLNEQFLLNDLYLPSGSYNLKISAFDGVNQTDSYIPLTINEFPKNRNGFLVFSNSRSITPLAGASLTQCNSFPFIKTTRFLHTQGRSQRKKIYLVPIYYTFCL